MKSKRLIIETTNGQKQNLEKILVNQGKTLTDWFNDKVEEEAAPYITIQEESDIQLGKLTDLADINQVFERLQKEDWDFTTEDTNYLSHNIHPYPAKYVPQIPNKVIRLLSLPGERVFDPFGGSGTTALEALLLGRQAFSADINPISSIIGQAKCKALNKEEEDDLRAFSTTISLLSKNHDNIAYALQQHVTDIQAYIPAIPNIEKWFHLHAVEELSYLRWAIETKLSGAGKILALSVFSKIITRVSFQDGETRYASKPREVDRGATLLIFYTELESTLRKIAQLPSNLRYKNARFIVTNSSTEKILDDNSIDLVVTSPPYPNTTDYHLYHRFRIFWLGDDPREMAKMEIGSHLRHQKANTDIEEYLFEMKGCLKKVFNCLRHGRYAVFVIGDGIYKGKQFDTAVLLEGIASEIGFISAGILDRKLPEHKRSFVSPARRLITERMLVLVKPNITQRFDLAPPPYTLWPYELELRKLEIKALLGDRVIIPGKPDQAMVNSLSIDQLKRLTFTHDFSGPQYWKEKSWQAILENGDGTDIKSKRKEPKYVTHGLHPYKGKFYPQLAKSLTNIANLKYGQHILDPFCGSGTVLLESYLNGIHSYGFDINPLALKIAKSKTAILGVDPILSERLLLRFIEDIRSVQGSVKNKSPFEDGVQDELQAWFPERVINKLVQIHAIINEIPNVQILEFIEICLSSIVRDISQQDPKDLRIRRRKDPIHDAPVIELLERKIKNQLERLKSFFQKSSSMPCAPGTTDISLGDCRTEEPFKKFDLFGKKVDAVITSPPYATALPYIDTDRLSILLLLGKKSRDRAALEKDLIGAREITNTERKAFELLIASGDFGGIKSKVAIDTIKKVYTLNDDEDVGFRRRNMAALLYRYYDDMSKVFVNLNKAVKENGNLFFVIGDNKTNAGGEDINIQSGNILVEMGKKEGWKLESVIPITVTQENKINNKNGITENEIIWFRK
jgi:DNA modification methylase